MKAIIRHIFFPELPVSFLLLLTNYWIPNGNYPKTQVFTNGDRLRK